MAQHDLHDQNTPPDASQEPAAPITSRFLFVDVAAQRAKQLRRGALARLDRAAGSGPHKLERVAMEEVRTGLIHYTLPTTHEGSPRGGGNG
jgi:DNA-directed RNA polymerase subunit K/omega